MRQRSFQHRVLSLSLKCSHRNHACIHSRLLRLGFTLHAGVFVSCTRILLSCQQMGTAASSLPLISAPIQTKQKPTLCVKTQKQQGRTGGRGGRDDSHTPLSIHHHHHIHHQRPPSPPIHPNYSCMASVTSSTDDSSRSIARSTRSSLSRFSSPSSPSGYGPWPLLAVPLLVAAPGLPSPPKKLCPRGALACPSCLWAVCVC